MKRFYNYVGVGAADCLALSVRGLDQRFGRVKRPPEEGRIRLGGQAMDRRRPKSAVGLGSRSAGYFSRVLFALP